MRPICTGGGEGGARRSCLEQLEPLVERGGEHQLAVWVEANHLHSEHGLQTTSFLTGGLIVESFVRKKHWSEAPSLDLERAPLP